MNRGLHDRSLLTKPASGADRSAPVVAPLPRKRKRRITNQPVPRIRRTLLARGAPRIEPQKRRFHYDHAFTSERPAPPAPVMPQSSSPSYLRRLLHGSSDSSPANPNRILSVPPADPHSGVNSNVVVILAAPPPCSTRSSASWASLLSPVALAPGATGASGPTEADHRPPRAT
jgi:hypothetical protein